MSDLISRKAMLKHIEKIRQDVQMMDDTHRAGIVMDGMYLCEKVVRNLPSVQPEVIRCKDCKKYDMHDHRCKHWNHGVVVMDWCSKAERRTDGR